MAQNKPTEDLRVRRTRKLITQAMIELTIEKGFAAITVQDIVERAMVNRATFYRHYLDKYDLLEKYMTEVYELTAVQERVASTSFAEAKAVNPPLGMLNMLAHVRQHADFYRVMLGPKGDPAFVEKIRQYSRLRLRSLLPEDSAPRPPDSPPLELCMSYLAHAGIGVFAWWLNEGQASSAEQVAVWLDQLNQATRTHLFGPVQ